MKCTECSSPVDKGAQFCPKCYARIEPPALWRRVLSWFQENGGQRNPAITIKRTINIKTTDQDGQQHEYHSLNEAPPEVRADLESLEAQAEEQALGGAATRKFVAKKTVFEFKVKTADGKEHVYHSLDELPPQLRAVIEKARKQLRK